MVFSTAQNHLAHLIEGKLKSNGINVWMLNTKDSMYNDFGTFEIYVKPEDVVKAKFIIEKDNE